MLRFLGIADPAHARTNAPAQVDVIFGLAGGTSTLALRLPGPELDEALAVPGYGREYRYPSSTVRAADLGEDWALVRPFGEINAAWCARAFAHAATRS